jgi:DNA-directed RNA polymerase subunit E'/Rpb7
MYENKIINTVIKLEAGYINKTSYEIDYKIALICNLKYSNRCHGYGFIVKNSINILHRDNGVIDDIIVDGGVKYNVKFNAICFIPKKNEKIIGVIIQNNPQCIHCELSNNKYNIPVNIYIPIQWHSEDKQKDLENLENKKHVQLNILSSRYIPGDEEMTIIAEFNRFIDKIDDTEHSCLFN